MCTEETCKIKISSPPKLGFRLHQRIVALVTAIVFFSQPLAYAKSSKRDYPDLTPLFQGPKTEDLLISFGISVGLAVVGGFAGSAMSKGGFSFTQAAGNSVANFGTGAFYGTIAQTVSNIAIYEGGMKPQYAQILGYATSGALSGVTTGWQLKGTPYASNFNTIKGFSAWNNASPALRGAVIGTLKGAAMGAGSWAGYEALKNTSLYKNNPQLAQQLGSFVGGTAGYLGFNTLASLGGMQTMAAMSLGDKAKQKIATSMGKDTQWLDQNRALATQFGEPQTVLFNTDFKGPFGGLKMALFDPAFKSSIISQTISLSMEAALGPKNAQYSRLLGQSLGSLAGSTLSGGKDFNFGKAVLGGIASGASSIALGYIGGEYDPLTGKNKLGLSGVQMEALNFVGTTLLNAGFQSGIHGFKWDLFKHTAIDSVKNLSIDYMSWGRTNPLYTRGAGGWSEAQFIQKVAQFGGIADLKANADTLMQRRGYTNWNEMVKDGQAQGLFPSMAYSFNNYATSSLHNAATQNLQAIAGGMIQGAGSWFKKGPAAGRAMAITLPAPEVKAAEILIAPPAELIPPQIGYELPREISAPGEEMPRLSLAPPTEQPREDRVIPEFSYATPPIATGELPQPAEIRYRTVDNSYAALPIIQMPERVMPSLILPLPGPSEQTAIKLKWPQWLTQEALTVHIQNTYLKLINQAQSLTLAAVQGKAQPPTPAPLAVIPQPTRAEIDMGDLSDPDLKDIFAWKDSLPETKPATPAPAVAAVPQISAPVQPAPTQPLDYKENLDYLEAKERYANSPAPTNPVPTVPITTGSPGALEPAETLDQKLNRYGIPNIAKPRETSLPARDFTIDQGYKPADMPAPVAEPRVSEPVRAPAQKIPAPNPPTTLPAPPGTLLYLAAMPPEQPAASQPSPAIAAAPRVDPLGLSLAPLPVEKPEDKNIPAFSYDTPPIATAKLQQNLETRKLGVRYQSASDSYPVPAKTAILNAVNELGKDGWGPKTIQFETGIKTGTGGRTALELGAHTLNLDYTLGPYQINREDLINFIVAVDKKPRSQITQRDLEAAAERKDAFNWYVQQSAAYWQKAFAKIGLYVNKEQLTVLVGSTGFPNGYLTIESAMALVAISNSAKAHGFTDAIANVPSAREALIKIVALKNNIPASEAQNKVDEVIWQHVPVPIGAKAVVQFDYLGQEHTLELTGTRDNSIASELRKYLGSAAQLPEKVRIRKEIGLAEGVKRWGRGIEKNKSPESIFALSTYAGEREAYLRTDAQGQADYQNQGLGIDFFNTRIGRQVINDIGGAQNIVPAADTVIYLDPHKIMRPLNRGANIARALKEEGYDLSEPLYSSGELPGNPLLTGYLPQGPAQPKVFINENQATYIQSDLNKSLSPVYAVPFGLPRQQPGMEGVVGRPTLNPSSIYSSPLNNLIPNQDKPKNNKQ